MAGKDDVLAANAVFYAAFAAADATGMDRLWARNAPVACIHPGWGLLAGRDEVVESWRRIFRAGQPDIVCHDAEAFVLGDCAFVVCLEILPDGVLIATNVFVREADGWRMVHHQAGPTAERPNIVPSSPTGARH